MKFLIRYHCKIEFTLLVVIGKTAHGVTMFISSKIINGLWLEIYSPQEALHLLRDLIEKFLSLVDIRMLNSTQCEFDSAYISYVTYDM